VYKSRILFLNAVNLNGLNVLGTGNTN